MEKKNEIQNLSAINIAKIDYKDASILKKFTNSYGRISARKRTGLSAVHQARVAQAIKQARYMGFLPYVAR